MLLTLFSKNPRRFLLGNRASDKYYSRKPKHSYTPISTPRRFKGLSTQKPAFEQLVIVPNY